MGEPHQKAFKLIIEKLASAPVLATPVLDQPLVVETDASKLALETVLLQKNKEGKEQPIAYGSRKLNKYESKYPPIELEALGLVFALREFRPYLIGAAQSLARTDNSAVCSLLHRKDLEGRLAKYQLIVQSYNIKIEYKKGTSNKF